MYIYKCSYKRYIQFWIFFFLVLIIRIYICFLLQKKRIRVIEKKMTIIKIVSGDICDTKLNYIMHQTNCVTTKSHGLAKAIFTKWLHGNIYARRKRQSGNTAKNPSKPGTVCIRSDAHGPSIINLFGQWAPGRPNGHWQKIYNTLYADNDAVNKYEDTKKDRLQFFKDALNELESKISKDESIAVPYKIGCGLAGGNWEQYETLLKNSSLMFVLYKLPPKHKK